MTRIQVLVNPESTVRRDLQGRVFDAEPYKPGDPSYAGWNLVNIDGVEGILFDNEIRVLGRHEGEYDPNHWGEQDPDSYDRMAWSKGDASWGFCHGRHLLHTGVE